MDRLSIGCVLGVTSVALGLGVAKLERIASPAPVASAAAPLSSDEAAIDQLLTDLYACISGPAGQERDWETFDRVFTPDARMAAYFQRPDGSVGDVKMTPEQYKERSGPMLTQSGFSESEVHRELEIYGSIAHAFSTYEGSFSRPNGEQSGVAGINSIQLVRTAEGWKVFSIIWQQADPNTPVPAKYLPKAEQ